MNIPLQFSLYFYPTSVNPTINKSRSYLLFNQCDGFHLAEAYFDKEDEFQYFYFFPNVYAIEEDFYVAWALLPDGSDKLYARFARHGSAA